LDDVFGIIRAQGISHPVFLAYGNGWGSEQGLDHIRDNHIYEHWVESLGKMVSDFRDGWNRGNLIYPGNVGFFILRTMRDNAPYKILPSSEGSNYNEYYYHIGEGKRDLKVVINTDAWYIKTAHPDGWPPAF